MNTSKPILLDSTGKLIAENISRIVDALQGRKPTVYGIRIDGNESSPSHKVTYLADAANMTPAKMNFDTNVFDYGSWADAFFMPRPCMLKYDGTVDYYLDDKDYTKKADGVTPSDVANLGYGGNAMMEWGRDGKQIWMKIVPSAYDTTANIYIADERVDKDYFAWSFIDCNGKLCDHFYTPIYNGSLEEYDSGDGVMKNRMRSISGQKPMHSKNATQEMEYAHNNNPNPSDHHWQMECFAHVNLINILLTLISKSTDGQTVFGYGRGSANYIGDAAQEYGKANTGTMDKMGLFWGHSASNAKDTPEKPAGVKVFGMEHWWGNIWRRYSGHMFSAGVHMFKMTYGKEDGSDTIGYNTSGTGYLKRKTNLTENGYIKTMVFDPIGGPLENDVQSSSSQYYCDYVWQTTGTAFACRGGYVIYDTALGPWCSDLDYGAGTAGWSLGSGVSYI